jgi:Uma2 family endonuclease
MAALKTARASKSAETRPTITDKAMFEIVDGRLVEMESMSVYAMTIAVVLVSKLQSFAEARGLGWVTMETLFRLPTTPSRSRRPDVAFVSAERWALTRPIPISGESWDVVPDLAVEVVSPSDRASNLQQKLTEYFDAGVRHVWVIHPESQLVEIYKSRYDVQIIKATDHLVDEAVLPGFAVPVKMLFPPFIPSNQTRDKS